MPLVGSAFVIMWHDIAAEGDAEYHLWHTREHMPERLDHPGFLRSRRGVNWGAARQRYFTLYEGETLETFQSQEYRRSLNGPSEWTSRVAPTFRNFLRMSCELLETRGRGVGGALTTIRFRLAEGMGERAALLALMSLSDDLMAMPAVTSVHVAVARPDFSNGRTRETEIRPAMNEMPFDMVVVIEGIGLMELERDVSSIGGVIESIGMRDVITGSYDMAYLLERIAA